MADPTTRLHAERERLVSQAEELAEQLDLAGWDCDTADVIDAGAASTERAALASHLTRVHTRIEDVDAALARLSDGTYGRCGVCGERIPRARLDALPTATTCIDHAPGRAE